MDVRGTGRVVVGVAGTLTAYEALRFAVAAARERRAPLIAVRAVRTTPAADTWPELRRALHDAARAEVATAFDEALGGVPTDVDLVVTTESGPVDRVLTAVANRPDDLLVVGAGSRYPWRGLSPGSVVRRCAQAATCTVVVVPARATAQRGLITRRSRSVADEAELFLRHAH